MISYYGYKISPNQIETGEGFLICRNVPIARIGNMDYLASELGLPGSDIIKVSRSPDEVFSDATLASFEGKPVTDEHPPELVTPETAILHLKGHSQNVRRGSGEWDGYVIADLHIQDEMLIKEIQNGKREVSCGYECDYSDNGDGTYSQHNIRGNHVAVVRRGRAGKKAAILDTNKNVMAIRPEREKMKRSKNSLFFKMFGRAAKDASPEELEQMAADAAEAMDQQDIPKPAEKEKDKEDQKGKESNDMNFSMDELAQRVVDMLQASQKEKTNDEDALDKAIAGLTEDAKESKVIAADTSSEIMRAGMDSDLALSILKRMRPAVAAIKDPIERKSVTDSILSCISAPTGESDISKIINATQKNAKVVADSNQVMDLDKIQASYDTLNPHKNGGNK